MQFVNDLVLPTKQQPNSFATVQQLASSWQFFKEHQVTVGRFVGMVFASSTA